MTTTARALSDLISVEYANVVDGEYWLAVGIDPADAYGSFKALPDAIEYESRVYGKLSFNSDTNRAYFKVGAPLGKAVRWI